ncbi:MaoC family dehydratase [Filifactor villosus]|uniref:MaoC family dehydratase n=1 Tax=Filifactor villosus TaxID=29374 RepID=A0ABV9QLG9_9FIRM
MDYNKIKVGDSATVSKCFFEEDVVDFADLSTDNNPIHLDKQYAEHTVFKKNIVHGMLVSSLISSVLGTKLPGEGSIYLKQSLEFLKPVYFGEECTAEVKVVSKNDDKRILVLETSVTKEDGKTKVISGQAVIKKM